MYIYKYQLAVEMGNLPAKWYFSWDSGKNWKKPGKNRQK